MRIVVPFSAGSNTDAQARILADKLSQMWKQQVIVENRPGIAGTASVAKSAPDGYTLMLTSSGHPVANVISRAAPFDPVKDFAGMTQVSAVSAAFAVPPELPANNLKEFVALAQKSPGKMNFASAGTASTSYLAGEIFKQIAKVNLVHIPYKGAPEALTSILRNDSQVYFGSTTFSPDLIAVEEDQGAGGQRARSGRRSCPDVPTAREAGVPDYVYESWFGVMAPAGHARRDPQQGLAPTSRSALKLPDVVKAVDNQGLGGGDAVARRVRQADRVGGEPLRQDPARRRCRRQKIDSGCTPLKSRYLPPCGRRRVRTCMDASEARVLEIGDLKYVKEAFPDRTTLLWTDRKPPVYWLERHTRRRSDRRSTIPTARPANFMRGHARCPRRPLRPRRRLSAALFAVASALWRALAGRATRCIPGVR